jgi:hypothetical protein
LAPIGLVLLLIFLFANNVEVLASVWRDPLSVLAARSPGQRDAGALYNTKHKRLGQSHAGPAGVVPHERVLAATRMRPDPVLPAELTVPLADFFGDQPFATFGPAALPLTGSFGGSGPSGTAPKGTMPPFSVGSFASPMPSSESLVEDDFPDDFPPVGNPLIVSPPDTNPPDDNPPGGNPPDLTASVPEPSTWLMNIVGLFAIAGVMRREKRRQRGPVRACAA